MINLDEIENSIIDLESRDTTFATCERLAWLYIVKDHLINGAKKTANTSGSAFMDACNGKDVAAVLGIVDEHLNCVNALYPKEYAAILAKIKAI